MPLCPRAALAQVCAFDSRERNPKRHFVVESVVGPFHEGARALLFLGIRKGMGSPKVAARLMTPATTFSWRVEQRWGESMYAAHLTLPAQIDIVSRSQCAPRKVGTSVSLSASR